MSPCSGDCNNGMFGNNVNKMVTKVSLQLITPHASLVVVSHALVPFQPDITRRAAARHRAPPPTRSEEDRRVRARLQIVSRVALPHELAGGECMGDDGAEILDRVARIHLADGSVATASARIIAKHSSFFAVLLSTEGWRETQSGEVEVTLAGHSPDAVRGVLGWMSAVGGSPKREAAAMCLVPELVAEVALLSHFLDCAPLLSAALVTIEGALAADNAPTCLVAPRLLD